MNLVYKPGWVTKALNGFVVFITACALVACGGGDGFTGNANPALSAASTPLFTTAPSSIMIATGAEPSYGIGGGTAPFKVISNDVSVATLTVTDKAFTLKGVKGGAATLVLSDAAGSTKSIEVTVTPVATTSMLVTPAAASASVGDVLYFRVSGGAPAYEVLVNNTSIAMTSTPTVSTSGGTFSLNLLKVGSTTIAITDGLGQTQTVTLTVDAAIAKLRLAPSALTIDENFKGSITFNIYGGSADATYTIFTSDQAFFKAPEPTQSMAFSSGLGTSSDRCILPNNVAPATITGIYDVQITVIDQSGASAVSVVSIRDNARGCS